MYNCPYCGYKFTTTALPSICPNCGAFLDISFIKDSTSTYIQTVRG